MSYFPLGTEATIRLECGHIITRGICGEFRDGTQIWCDRCIKYTYIEAIFVTKEGCEQGKSDIPHHLPELT